MSKTLGQNELVIIIGIITIVFLMWLLLKGNIFSDNETQQNGGYCSACGFSVDNLGRFCENCGHELVTEYVEPRSSDQITEKEEEGVGESRSLGSKMSAFASIVVSVAFFLPWVRACNSDATGYQLATNTGGRIRAEEPWLIWLTFAAAIIILLMFVFIRNFTQPIRLRTGWFRMIFGIIGLFPIFMILMNALDQDGRIEILYGAWVTVGGYTLIIISSIIDLVSDGETSIEIDSG